MVGNLPFMQYVYFPRTTIYGFKGSFIKSWVQAIDTSIQIHSGVVKPRVFHLNFGAIDPVDHGAVIAMQLLQVRGICSPHCATTEYSGAS